MSQDALDNFKEMPRNYIIYGQIISIKAQSQEKNDNSLILAQDGWFSAMIDEKKLISVFFLRILMKKNNKTQRLLLRQVKQEGPKHYMRQPKRHTTPQHDEVWNTVWNIVIFTFRGIFRALIKEIST